MEQLKQIQESIFQFLHKTSYYITEYFKEIYENYNLNQYADFLNFDYIYTYFFINNTLTLIAFLLWIIIAYTIMKSIINFIKYIYKLIINNELKTYLIIDWDNYSIIKAKINNKDYKYLNSIYRKSPITIHPLNELENYKFNTLLDKI